MQSFLIVILIKIFIQQLQVEFVSSLTTAHDFIKSVEAAKEELEWIKTVSDLYNINSKNDRTKRNYGDEYFLNNLIMDSDDSFESVNGDAWYKNFCNAGSKKLTKIKDSDRKLHTDEGIPYKNKKITTDDKYYSKYNQKENYAKDDYKEEIKESYPKGNYSPKPVFKSSWNDKSSQKTINMQNDKKPDDTDRSFVPKFMSKEEENPKKNDLSHEADYKLSKIEQDASEKSSLLKAKKPIVDKYILFPLSESLKEQKPTTISEVGKKAEIDNNIVYDYMNSANTPDVASIINQIKLKTSEKLMNKGFGASLPSDFIEENLKQVDNIAMRQPYQMRNQNTILGSRFRREVSAEEYAENEEIEENETQTSDEIKDDNPKHSQDADQQNEHQAEQNKRNILKERKKKKAKASLRDKEYKNLENLINAKTPFNLIHQIFEMVQQNACLKQDLWPGLKKNNDIMVEVAIPWVSSSENIKICDCITLPEYLQDFYNEIEKTQARNKDNEQSYENKYYDIDYLRDGKKIKREMLPDIRYSTIRDKYETVKKLLNNYDFLTIQDQEKVKDIKEALESNLCQIRRIQSKDEREKRLLRSTIINEDSRIKKSIQEPKLNITAHYKKLVESATSLQKSHLNDLNGEDYQINLFI